MCNCTSSPLCFPPGNLSVGLCPLWSHRPHLACLCTAAEPLPEVSLPEMSRPPYAETCCVWCKGAVCLLWTNGFVLHWENRSQNVKAVFCTGIDCSFPKGSSSVPGFYFVVPKQNCSHTVKQANILAFASWLRMKSNVFGLSVGWTQFPSPLQQEHTPCQEARMSPRDVLLLLSARLIQPVSFKVCGNELQSHHSCGGFSEEIAEGSQRLWKSPFR